MAHDINYNSRTGKHAFMSVKEKAWHGLGQIIEHYPNSSEAIQYAGLNFEVEKRPLFTCNSENHEIFKDTETDEYMNSFEPNVIVPDYFATVRTDTDEVLGMVGRDYNVVQNMEAFSFFDGIVGGGSGIKYETAGCLGRGQVTFITAKLPDYIRVGREDLIEQYLFLTSSHDGSGSISIAFTPVRIVCANTLNAAMRHKSNCIKIRHTASATDKLKQAHKMLGLSNSLATEMEAIYNRWSRVRISDPELKRLIQLAMVPNRETLEKLKTGQDEQLSTQYQNIIENVYEYAQSSPTQQEATTKGTVFGAYNSVTGYFQNVRDYKNGEAKFRSIMTGTALSRTQTAFDLCMNFAKTGGAALN
jgi:phage/plasmid-like protein (TIGR03299 family)